MKNQTEPTGSDVSVAASIQQEMPCVSPAFSHNKEVILAALKAVQVARVSVRYEGCGDEGRICEVSWEPGDVDLDVIDVLGLWGCLCPESLRWLDEGLRPAVSIRVALEDLCNDAIEGFGHRLYQDGEGGGGDLTLDVAAGAAVLQHYDYFVHQEDWTHAF